MVKKGYSFKSSHYGNTAFKKSKAVRYYFYAFFEKISYFILIVLSIIMMSISVFNSKIDMSIRGSILYISRPMLVISELPFNIIFDSINGVKNILLTNIINRKLSQENIILKKLYLESLDIKKENENLKKLLNFSDNIEENYDYVTSKVYTNTKAGVGESVLVNIGHGDNIREGNLVLGTNRSVVGRVVNVGEKYSKILLITDINSKIPARIASTNEKIIVSGGNRDYLEIAFFNSKNLELKDGDLVFTSGDSDIIPDGFFIGTVRKQNESFSIEIDENLNRLFNVLIIISKD